MKSRYKELVERDNMRKSDVERKALFHIIAGNAELYKHVDDIYNFDDHTIKLNVFKKAWMTSGSRGLLKLAFNLYNGSQKNSTYESFVYLDKASTFLALEAITIRFVR
ncbi:hypothetical protein EZV73_26725 [Acidaminobacter sp. JC074]|uniref:DUF6075 family protein n=1 Tax=Acidaminobacter sp. JC074 TaxID=2530199 RepID=UPI001F0DDF6E|nr:DUF6075 family protein [Acidaminobacter sp. JC074]MCH4891202.1 hypothetical protein [Acidaminobacter sp. JC074]